MKFTQSLYPNNDYRTEGIEKIETKHTFTSVLFHSIIRALTEKENRETLTVALEKQQHGTAENPHHVFSVGFLHALCSIVIPWVEA